MRQRLSQDSGKGSERQRQAAQALAVEALAYLAAEPELIGAFLAVSGIGPEAIRDAAREPHFLSGVLEHIASDERLLIEFAAHAQRRPEEIGRARAALGDLWERDGP